MTEMANLRSGLNAHGRVASRRLVFDSGLLSLDDPRITALHEGYDDLVKRFSRPAENGPRPAAAK